MWIVYENFCFDLVLLFHIHPTILPIFMGLGVWQSLLEENMKNGFQGGLAQHRDAEVQEFSNYFPFTQWPSKLERRKSKQFQGRSSLVGHCANWECHTVQKHVAGGMRKRCKLMHRFYSSSKKSIRLGAHILLHSMKAQLKMAFAIHS